MSNFKKEGTTQTYGQLIVFPSEKSNFIDVARNSSGFKYEFVFDPETNTTKYAEIPVDPKNTSVDILVQIVSDTPSSDVKLEQIDDVDRTKIILSAFNRLNSNIPVTITTDDLNFKKSIQEGITNPEQVKIVNQSTKVNNFAVVLGSSHKTKNDLINVISNASKVDSFLTVKSKSSDVVEYNNLQNTENLKCKFVYNFYTTDETDVALQENQLLDPLVAEKKSKFDVPRYVQLEWNQVKEAGNDFRDLSSFYFSKPSGLIGYNSRAFKDSYDNSKSKITSPLEGKEIVDVHALDKALISTANGARFANTIAVVFDPLMDKSRTTNCF